MSGNDESIKELNESVKELTKQVKAVINILSGLKVAVGKPSPADARGLVVPQVVPGGPRRV